LALFAQIWRNGGLDPAGLPPHATAIGSSSAKRRWRAHPGCGATMGTSWKARPRVHARSL